MVAENLAPDGTVAPAERKHTEVAVGILLRDDGAMLLWEFHFRTRGLGAQTMCIKGASHMRFDAAGCVTEHRDYWDAAGELYARLPLLGALMRLLQGMGAAK